MQKHCSTPEDLMLQSATRLRNSVPWPPKISDEHVSCTAPATRHASLQIVPRLPSFWKLLQGPHVLLTFTRCAIPCPWHTKRHLNVQEYVQKCSVPVIFLHFWLRNVLRATTACTFSTCQLPKVPRDRQFLTLLNSKCASHHNSVHFFDMSTSKSAPALEYFVHFYLEMCFAPQRHALFRRLNFQKCSETVSF